MSRSDSFQSRLKSAQSNIWKSANKLFGRNVSGGGDAEFVSGGGIQKDFPKPIANNPVYKKFLEHQERLTDSNGKQVSPYNVFQALYKQEVDPDNHAASLARFKKNLMASAPSADSYAAFKRAKEGSSTSGSPRKQYKLSPVQRGQREAPEVPEDLQLAGGLEYEDDEDVEMTPRSAKSSRSSSAKSSRSAQGGAKGKFGASPFKGQAYKDAYLRYKESLSDAEFENKTGRQILADFQAMWRKQQGLGPKKMKRDDMITIVDEDCNEKTVAAPKPPKSEAKRAKTALRKVIDREYTSQRARREGARGDIFIKNHPEYANLDAQERYKKFFTEVYENSEEKAEVDARKSKNTLGPNLWQRATKGMPRPRQSYKAWADKPYGSPEHIAYDKFYSRPRYALDKKWQGSPQKGKWDSKARSFQEWQRVRQ